MTTKWGQTAAVFLIPQCHRTESCWTLKSLGGKQKKIKYPNCIKGSLSMRKLKKSWT